MVNNSGITKIRDELLQILKKLNKNNTKKKEFSEKNTSNQLMDAERASKEFRVGQYPKMLDSLRRFGEMLNPTGYDIVITSKEKPNYHFRGVLDKSWLRHETQLYRSLYGGQSEAPWSMVGLVTHVPGTYVNLSNVETNRIPET